MFARPRSNSRRSFSHRAPGEGVARTTVRDDRLGERSLFFRAALFTFDICDSSYELCLPGIIYKRGSEIEFAWLAIDNLEFGGAGKIDVASHLTPKLD